ncbi:hypothetical protein EDC30_103223 [Paucimonas lemoignei]|uniref:Uncharacterized protein n=1 Tax=Paucimonas lemoignei TaxID=29443 RepID=A0A4R3HZX9_PAULE|nr:hypothetical protein [Paucimonas lemoignei]TCS37931.1 hypothetical protein EDC30_103223 [Paucimonas lemoignei]
MKTFIQSLKLVKVVAQCLTPCLACELYLLKIYLVVAPLLFIA